MNSQLLVGTYTTGVQHTTGRADGILSAHSVEGGLGNATLAAEIRNPSWLALSDDGSFLYSVIETSGGGGCGGSDGEGFGGGVAAFARDFSTGELVLINERSSEGDSPAHLAIDPTGRFVVVANYDSGSVVVFPRREDGGLAAPSDRVRHTASGPPPRQTRAHPHQVVFDPTTGEVLVPDLGMDAVLSYELTPSGTLVNARRRITLAPRAGPRHLAFIPGGEHLCVLNELDSTIATFRRDGTDFTPIDVVSTLPSNFRGENHASAIRVNRRGDLVFASNRGHDTIAVFRFQEDSQRLGPIQWVPTGGSWPRDFILTDDDTRVLVANQHSDTVVSVRLDDDGRLSHRETISAQSPVCLVLADG